MDARRLLFQASEAGQVSKHGGYSSAFGSTYLSFFSPVLEGAVVVAVERDFSIPLTGRSLALFPKRKV